MPDADPILQVSRLTHTYGDRRALDDVTFTVQPAEIFGFLGPNGSGKTTLFRILSTLMTPQSGTVTIAGLDVAKERDEVRKRIGVVFQSPSLDKQLTAEENLRHHGHLYGLRGAALESRMDEMLARFNLNDRRREYVQNFSGGMRRRVELAKGLLTRPQMLLLDEPSTGLDPAARIDMWRFLHDVRSQDNVTVLLTTHLMDEGDKCDRLAILEQGHLRACDSPTALKERIGGDIITLITHDPPGLKLALREKLGIEADPIDNIVRIERPRAHEFIPQLVETLPGLIDSVSLSKPSLEDVFIDITGHRFKNEEPTPTPTRRGRASR